MDRVYDVRLGNEVVGTMCLNRQGLYYHFSCSCKLTGAVICKILARCGDVEIDLGICVPTEYGFGFERRLPVKRFPGVAFSFYALPRHNKLDGHFVAIRADEPFRYITKLQDAHLTSDGDRIGIVLSAGSEEINRG